MLLTPAEIKPKWFESRQSFFFFFFFFSFSFCRVWRKVPESDAGSVSLTPTDPAVPGAA